MKAYEYFLNCKDTNPNKCKSCKGEKGCKLTLSNAQLQSEHFRATIDPLKKEMAFRELFNYLDLKRYEIKLTPVKRSDGLIISVLDNEAKSTVLVINTTIKDSFKMGLG